MPFGDAPRDAAISAAVPDWERELRAAAANKGVAYDDSDLQGVIRNASYAQNAGGDPRQFMTEALGRYDVRAAPTTGRSFDSQGPMYDQRTNSLNAAGQAALAGQGRTPTRADLGFLLGLTGTPENPYIPAISGFKYWPASAPQTRRG